MKGSNVKSTNSNEKMTSQLIEIIENAKDEETLISAMNDPNADSNVLDAAYERAKKIFGIKSYEFIVFVENLIDDLCYKESDKGYFELLIKIITETRNERHLTQIITSRMKDTTCNQDILKAVFKRVEILRKEDSEQHPYIVRNVIGEISGYYSAEKKRFIVKGSTYATPELLMQIIKNYGEYVEIILAALQHENATAKMIYDYCKPLENIEIDEIPYGLHRDILEVPEERTKICTYKGNSMFSADDELEKLLSNRIFWFYGVDSKMTPQELIGKLKKILIK